MKLLRRSSIQAVLAAIALSAASVSTQAQAPAQPPPAAAPPDFSKVEIKTTKLGPTFSVLEGQGGAIGVLAGPDGVLMIDSQFAFTDAIWAKHGAALSESDKFVDPKTSQAPIVNVYRGGLDGHVKHGVHFAICDLATHRLASFIARKSEANADAIYKELTTNALGNGHFVAAGILAVNRAQERGYAVAYVG